MVVVRSGLEKVCESHQRDCAKSLLSEKGLPGLQEAVNDGVQLGVDGWCFFCRADRYWEVDQFEHVTVVLRITINSFSVMLIVDRFFRMDS